MINLAAKSFLKSYFFVVAPIMGLVVLINYIMNPFAFFAMQNVKGFNAIKTQKNNNIRLFKACEIIQQKPTAIILGSSRIMAGIDPEDLKKAIGSESYNAGITRANFEEIYEYFLHAVYSQPNLNTVLLGLDPFCFSASEKVKEDLPKFLHNNQNLWIEKLSALFSFSGLRASWETFYHNYYCNDLSDAYFPNGLFDPKFAGDITANPIIVNGEMAYLKDLHQASMYKYFDIDEKSLKKFQSLVDICKERSINLKVFFNPTQAPYWEAFFQHGYWEKLEELKTKLCHIYPLWDFSGFNPVTTRNQDNQACSLYYECSHFRPVLGKMLIDILFEKKSPPVQFGHMLNSETVKEALLFEREERDIWAQAHPKIVEELTCINQSVTKVFDQRILK